MIIETEETQSYVLTGKYKVTWSNNHLCSTCSVPISLKVSVLEEEDNFVSHYLFVKTFLQECRTMHNSLKKKKHNIFL